MKISTILLASLLFLPGLTLSAQSRTTIEWLPQLSWSGKLGNHFNLWLNTSLENDLNEQAEGASSGLTFIPHTYNAQAGLSYKLAYAFDLATGYQFGWRGIDEEDSDIEQRSLQQISWTNRWGKYRARLRGRMEQRFFRSRNWKVRHRWRLRLALDFPLQGERLDIRETYLNIQAESLSNIFESAPLFKRKPVCIQAGVGRPAATLGWKMGSNGVSGVSMPRIISETAYFTALLW